MPFVIDASAAGCWALKDEEDPAATAALLRLDRDEGLVPVIWWFELRNTLLVAERRGRISGADSGAFLFQLSQLPINVDRQPQESELLLLARRHRLTAYDAAYLELARRTALSLATLDAALARAARAEHVPLVGHGG